MNMKCFSFKNKSGFGYKNMLFFDDEARNIHDLTKVGVKSILVSRGVTLKLVNDAVNEFVDV